MLPPITMVNSKPLLATIVKRQFVRMRDGAGTKRSHAINFVVADISYYDINLGIAWLQKQDPNIH